MFGHDGFMGSNAPIGVGACFSSQKPTIIFIGDAALEEDYVLASLSWIAKKRLPVLFVVEDNNFAVLTKKEDRRDWSAKDVAKKGIESVPNIKLSFWCPDNNLSPIGTCPV